MTAVDVDAYLARIGWSGGRLVPSEDVLASIVRAHVERIPFENFDVLLGRGIALDLPSLEDKLVHRRRGGYCFEHATLAAAVLREIGFAVTMHSGRVIVHRPKESAGRTHMFLAVHVGSRTFIADVGYGNAPRSVLPLEEGTVRDGHEVHHLAKRDDEWVLEAGEARSPQWTTTLAADLPIDFEVGNHYTATHPRSGFVNNLWLRAWTSFGRVAVTNREATSWRDGRPESLVVEDRAALRAFVVRHLGFDLPEIERLRVPAIADWS